LEEAQDEDKALLRLKIALLKIRTAQEAIDFAHQAIELHGGNGYIEDFVTPRLLRDAQVLTVWEGPENILCLEVLRLIKKFNVDEFFIDEVRAIMDRTPDQLAHLLLPVEEAMQTLNAQLEQLKKADAFSETLLVKRITHLMTDIYLSAMALEAAWDGDSRKTVRAEIFINETLKNVDPASDVFAARHFDLIINHTQTAIH
jgi:DNA-binding transcriptional MerR regulator